MQIRFRIRPIILILFVLTVAFGLTACSSPKETATTTANTSNVPAGDNSGKSPSGTMASSPAAANAPYDLQFIDTMSVHHGSAIEMAKLAQAKAQHPELKAFAKKIIDDQQKEIAQMKGWRGEWYAGKPEAVNLELPGMMHTTEGMDLGRLSAATGAAFDITFLEMMTQHHQGAVAMAKEAMTKSGHPEIKRLARQIAGAQQQEIAQMGRWKAAWAGAK
ncbi:MAG: DUF305 domain-containing protein [Pyrinomonadaceae bacterium]